MYFYTKFHAKLDQIKLKLKQQFNSRSTQTSILFITGASSNHFKTLLQLLCNLSGLKIANPNMNVIVWDLGLSAYQLEFIKLEFSDFPVERFPFENYPDWFDITKEAGQYAWKPHIIAASVDHAKDMGNPFLCWVDSGDLFYDLNLSPLIQYLDAYDLYSPISSGDIEQWTHPGMLEFFKVKSWPFSVINLPMRNGAFLAFNVQKESVRKLINEFRDLAGKRDCIAPIGSDRSNHRQDQALFTLLYYQYLYRHRHPYNNRYLGFTIHNDVDR